MRIKTLILYRTTAYRTRHCMSLVLVVKLINWNTLHKQLFLGRHNKTKDMDKKIQEFSTLAPTVAFRRITP